jgi:23S rRNA (guanine745-N1)-methyltransferase
MPSVLDDVIRFLACPHCGEPLVRAGMSLRCRTGHAFDVARQGYVSLLPPGGKGNAGDTAAMVQAREDFLAAGYFGPAAVELADAAAEAAGGAAAAAGGAATEMAGAMMGGGCIVDVGAGTGYYLAKVLARLPGHAGLALDASRFALRRAARAHERIGAAGCDVWQHLPVTSGAAVVVLNVFAPRNGAELQRILAPGGRLLVITPTLLHMSELIPALGLLTVDRHKDERLARTLDPYFNLTEKRHIRGTVSLNHKDIAAAVMMGPSAWQSDPAGRQARIRRLGDPLPVTLSVTLSVYARSER